MNWWSVNMWDITSPDVIIAKNGLTFEEYINTIYTTDYDKIVIFCHTEFEFYKLFRYNEIVKAANYRNKTVTGVVGVQHEFLSYPEQTYVPNNLEIICWDTVFCRETIEQLLHPINLENRDTKKIEKILIHSLDNLDYEHHFVCLNGKAHDHRTQLLDHIAKHDLLQYSAYSWHNEYISLPEHRYHFQWYDGHDSILDRQFKTKRDQCFLPKQYYKSFFQIVPETSTVVPFITEKTIVPLLVGKPFFVVGSVGINKKLKNLGFELYEELFDYDFDDMDKPVDKYEYICGMIKNITDIPLKELKKLHKKIEDKIIHNRKRVIEIAYDDSFLPEIVKQVIDLYEETGEVKEYYMIKTHKRLKDLKETLYNNRYIRNTKTVSVL